MARYKVKAKCKNGHIWTTKAKRNASAPHQCPTCGTTKTKTIHAYRVD